jgi:hypothetical protein
MTAKFYVVGSFLVPSRNLFVAVGDIVDGSVEAGMNETVNLANVKVGTTVQSVELIEVSYLNRSYKGLAFAFEDPAELGFWQMLQLSDETLQIESA